MKKQTTSIRLQEYMETYDVKQVDILEMAKPYVLEYGVKLNKNDLSQYVSGKVEPGQDKTFILSKALDVDPSWIMGLDVPMKKLPTTKNNKTNQIPLLGNIAAGTPILAEENIESYFNLDSSIHADFILKVKGDSMINAGIHEGDLVFIKRQQDLENGAIGAILIEDEATLKRFYRDRDTIILQAENDAYKPIILKEGNVRILGKLSAILNIKDN